MSLSPSSSSVAPQEIARFSAQAGQWWDPAGAFRSLHQLSPLRLAYIRRQIAAQRGRKDEDAKPFKGLRVLDVGCGGGLMAEPLARLGAQVVGLDASAEAIETATAHAAQGGLKIDYRQGSAEALAQEGEAFDVIVALEIVEHVADLKVFTKALAAMLKPGGLLIVATVNRTKRSFLLAVVAAEYVLNWIPPGTHDWDKFVKPSDLAALWESAGITPCDCTGVVFSPWTGRFEERKGRAAVNYFMTGKKEKEPRPRP